jgi:hypothetical protein
VVVVKMKMAPIRLAFGAREGARVWWCVEEVKRPPPTHIWSEGGDRGGWWVVVLHLISLVSI